jgi:membrane-associated phospholipid phosphatase
LFRKRHIAYNPFFLFPFLLWVIGGGILCIVYNKEELFRAINGHHSAMADNAMFYATWMGDGNFIIPILFLIMLIPKFRNWQYFFTALMCNIIPFLIQQALKSYYSLPRPFNYFHNAYWIHYLPNKWPYLSERSFPSGHSAGAFSFFCFVALLLPARYYKLGFLFFICALLVSYSRVYLTAHFFEDVYIGSIVGAGTTTIVFLIMDRYKHYFFKKTTIFI